MKVGNISAQISDVSFKRDLTYIQSTLKQPIIIIMDECDVLGKSKIHLERLRNTFMNLSGIMLVLTGTEALFPIIDDVFSPIIRQFKKISVKPFDREEETRDCVQRPLQNLEIEPYAILDMETFFDIPAIHDLSGGRPYEIQLLCHLLFRRIQQGRAEKMTLTSDVLDEVLSELQSSQDTSLRSSITKIRGLEKDQLSALSVLCASNGSATFEQIWFLEYLLNGITKWTRETLWDNFQYFRKINLLAVDENGMIGFIGDDFDKIYAKYYSRKHSINLSIDNDSPETSAGYKLGGILHNKINFSTNVFMGGVDVLNSDVQEAMSLFFMEDDDPLVVPLKNPFDIYPVLARRIYEANFRYYNQKAFQIIGVTLTSPWYKARRFFTIPKPDNDDEFLSYKETVSKAVHELSERALHLGGKVEYDTYILPILSRNILSTKLSSSRNEKMKEQMFSYHTRETYDNYEEQKDKTRALLHGEAALSCKVPDDGASANNLGYVFMSSEKIELAKGLFEKSIEIYNNGSASALPEYNLAVLMAKQELFNGFFQLLVKAKQKAENTPDADLRCACLILPFVDVDGKLKYKEVLEPFLLDTINSAKSNVENYLDSQKK
jgi:hypothetical protein